MWIFPIAFLLLGIMRMHLRTKILLFKMVVPKVQKNFYDMMCQTPDLCGNFELDEDTGYIVWNLYENIRIGIDVYGTDCCLTLADWFSERSKTVLRIGILMCWKSTTKSAMSEKRRERDGPLFFPR